MASVIVQAVVILLDVIAFGLGVAAVQCQSQTTVSPDDTKEYGYHVYDSDIAMGYGVGALLLLADAQVMLMVASRCFCCGRGLEPGGSRACALIPFLFTWFTEAALDRWEHRLCHHGHDYPLHMANPIHGFIAPTNHCSLI
ncbi:unnamed protein product [Miscanthus lutarioriparius]|uniref:Uncharacterized protein n=1 Tax=Miscanthus lutarioriparius TaxID=422564 RepID=A0A811Q2K9_9POAL|nr:unnamed protein product [Miscanthus lutarioriparius]